jgi:glycosyltransferase involved in cell wall biosynthesis
MKKKLLFIMGCLENGGGERSLINLLQLIDYEKYDVDLILFKERGLFLNQVPKEVHMVSGDLEELHFLYNDSLKNAIDLRRMHLSFVHTFGTAVSKIKSKSGFHKGQYRWEHYYCNAIPKLKKQYDVAVSFLEGETMFYLVDKVQADRKIAWIHTDYSKINADHEMDYRYFCQVEKVVSISETCVAILKKTFPNIADKFVRLPNLINSNSIRFLAKQFYPVEYKADELKFVSVGRLIQLKGFDLAIQAASLLKKKDIKFKWYVLGDGELRTELEELKRKFEVMDYFEFLGARDNPYVYMLNADIVIQPSRYERKSMVLDEAKILGKPIVVTNYDTVHDQINLHEGIIVEMTPESIANGIEQMITEKKKYSDYLLNHEYGNQDEINNYHNLFEGK